MNEQLPPGQIYTASFFQAVRGGSADSADVVVPRVHDWLRPARVLDVGCGEGAWLARFAALGAAVLGLDGGYVDTARLLIPAAAFRPHDLREPLPADVLAWGADLVICLEVAEHLPPQRGPGLIEDLTSAADIVLFSAAVPGQGGYGHINEQPHEFWIELFEENRFAITRILQRQIAGDDRVAWWYQKNLLVACRVGRSR
jgi:SAM-dependent methyltransferase